MSMKTTVSRTNKSRTTMAARLCLTVLVATGSCLPLHAHEDGVEGKPRHGGQYVMDAYHHGVEMVVEDTKITFHMTEHLEPADMTGGSFKAIVQTDAGTKILPLSIDKDRLTASLGSPLPKGAKVALSGKDTHGNTIQARFVQK